MPQGNVETEQAHDGPGQSNKSDAGRHKGKEAFG